MEPEVNERFERIEGNLDRLIDVVSSLAQVVKSHEERLDRLAEFQAETHGELSALIHTMDEWIRGNPRDGGQSPQS